MIITGIAMSTQLTSMPSMTSRTFPVGSSLPVTAPIASRKVSLIGAAASATPSIRVSPSYSTRPPGVWITASISVRVLTLKIRTSVSRSPGCTRPASIANGPTPESMLPQFGLVSTSASFTDTWAKR